MHDLRTLQPHKHLRALGYFLFGALCAFQVNAATFNTTQSGNSVTYSANPYASDAAIAGASLAISAGAMYATQPSTVKTLRGVIAPLVVRAAPAAGAISSALLACFGNPLCVVATAAAAAYVANELAYQYSTDPVTGAPVIKKSDPAICTVAPCYNWKSSYAGSVYRTTTAAACADYVAGFLAATGYQSATLSSCSGASNGVVMSVFTGPGRSPPNYSYTATGTLQSTVVPPSSAAFIPATAQEFSTAIGAKTDWASDSKIGPLLDQVVKNKDAAGVPIIIPLSIPTVTGPSQIAGTPTTTTRADGSKTTTTTRSNLGYFGPRVDFTETTTVEETTPAGVKTTTSTTESPAYVEEKAPATDYDIPQADIPKTTKTITFAAENLGFGGGSCPADVMSQPHGMAAPIKLVDWTSNCTYVTTYAKPMILALALFSALMIIFVGGKPE